MNFYLKRFGKKCKLLLNKQFINVWYCTKRNRLGTTGTRYTQVNKQSCYLKKMFLNWAKYRKGIYYSVEMGICIFIKNEFLL